MAQGLLLAYGQVNKRHQKRENEWQNMGIFHRVLTQLSKPQKNESQDKATNNRLLAQVQHFGSLIRLQDERQLIEVIAPDFNDSFQSMIIGVDLYHQQLIIDEFSPKLHAPETLIGQTITLRHQNKRQMLAIDSEVIGWEDNHRSLVLNLPEEVTYQPRRQEQRLTLRDGTVMKAIIDPIYGAPWYASISNISMGGMRILVTGDLRGNLHKNKALRDCDIHLDERQHLHPAGRVKAFSYQGRPYRCTEISIAFERMNDSDSGLLEGFIQHLHCMSHDLI